MSDLAPSVSSEEAPADLKHCKKCGAPFPTGKAVHEHLKSCGKSPSEHRCRCAAVETELQEIKGLLAQLLASKSTPELNPSFTPFKELKQLQQESPLDYACRLEEEFCKLPVVIQYQRNTRYHLYEHIKASTPEIYSRRRRFYDSQSDVFDVFYHWKDDIKDNHRESVYVGGYGAAPRPTGKGLDFWHI